MNDHALKPCKWKMVPVEPTEEMRWAFWAGFDSNDTSPAFHGAYRAMLASTPTPAPADDEVGRVARALARLEWGAGIGFNELHIGRQEDFIRQARAAIAAIRGAE